MTTFDLLDMGGYWLPVRDGDPRAYALYRRHYSARRHANPRDVRIVGPGEHLLLLSPLGDALFVWRWKPKPDLAGESGVCCTIFRNESNTLSSVLIMEADEYAEWRWPGIKRHYTYVNPRQVLSRNPGYCFLCAGWSRSGVTRSGLIILERWLG